MTGSMHAMRPVFFASICFAFLLAASGYGQRRHGPSPLDTLGKEPVQSVGWAVLQKARSLTLGGDYEFRFQLKVMPRRGKTRSVDGVMVGTWNDRGPLTRLDVEVERGSVGADGAFEAGETERLLLQSGLFAKAWRRGGGESDEMEVVSSDRYFDKIAGTEFTPFDLFMPFVYWSDFLYEGETRHRSRPVHVFWMNPPEDDKTLGTVVSGVRVYIDDQFGGMVQAEIFGPDKTHLKTLSIVEFKKERETGEWYPKSIDARNEVTRDKTRFSVTGATLRLGLPDRVFELEGLAESIFDLRAEDVPNAEL